MNQICRPKILRLAFCVGLTSLIYQIYSVKVLFLFLAETTQAVSLTIAAFLAGIAISSLIISRMIKEQSQRSVRLLYWMQFALIVYVVLILRNYQIITSIYDYLILSAIPIWLSKLSIGWIVWFYLFIPAFLLGGTFPLLNGLYLTSVDRGTRETGEAYFVDTLGSIFGALVAGFFLLPYFGLERALLLPLLINIMILFSLTITKLQVTLSVSLAFFTLCNMFLSITEIPGAYASKTHDSLFQHTPLLDDVDGRFGKVQFQQSSPFGIITVGVNARSITGNKALFINYRDMCNTAEAVSEKALGTLALHEMDSKLQVLNIGLGCGLTASALGSNESLTKLDIVEINPVIAEAAKRFFSKENNNILANPKSKLHLEDGTRFLRLSRDSYHAIVIDVEEPTIVYSSPLFTQEYFKIAHDRLLPEGRLALWVLATDRYLGKILYNTAQAVFNHVQLRLIGEHLLLFASDSNLQLGPDSPEELSRVDDIIHTDSLEVNTLDNRSLERHIDVRKVFRLPKIVDEPFLREN